MLVNWIQVIQKATKQKNLIRKLPEKKNKILRAESNSNVTVYRRALNIQVCRILNLFGFLN